MCCPSLLCDQLLGMTEFWPGRIPTVTRFQQRGIVGIRLWLLSRLFGSARCPIETVEAFGAQLQIGLIFDQCFLGALQFEQQICQHFPRRNDFGIVVVFVGFVVSTADV